MQTSTYRTQNLAESKSSIDTIVNDGLLKFFADLVQSVVNLTNYFAGTNLTEEYNHESYRGRKSQFVEFYEASCGKIHKIVLDPSGDLASPGFSQESEIRIDSFIRQAEKDPSKRADVLKHIFDYLRNLKDYAKPLSKGHEEVVMRVL